jgi:hypothetical protein
VVMQGVSHFRWMSVLESHSLTFVVCVLTMCDMCAYVFMFNVQFVVPYQTIMLCSRLGNGGLLWGLVSNEVVGIHIHICI